MTKGTACAVPFEGYKVCLKLGAGYHMSAKPFNTAPHVILRLCRRIFAPEAQYAVCDRKILRFAQDDSVSKCNSAPLYQKNLRFLITKTAITTIALSSAGSITSARLSLVLGLFSGTEGVVPPG